MKTIVALVDFTHASSQVLNYTRTLASALGSKVVLLHVVPLVIPVALYGAEAPLIPIDPSPETVQENRLKLEELLQSLTQTGISATAQQLTGHVAETILDAASRLQADLVIMASHHHSALYNLFVGSTTADVLKSASVPVLVLPYETPEGG